VEQLDTSHSHYVANLPKLMDLGLLFCSMVLALSLGQRYE